MYKKIIPLVLVLILAFGIITPAMAKTVEINNPKNQVNEILWQYDVGDTVVIKYVTDEGSRWTEEYAILEKGGKDEYYNSYGRYLLAHVKTYDSKGNSMGENNQKYYEPYTPHKIATIKYIDRWGRTETYDVMSKINTPEDKLIFTWLCWAYSNENNYRIVSLDGKKIEDTEYYYMANPIPMADKTMLYMEAIANGGKTTTPNWEYQILIDGQPIKYGAKDVPPLMRNNRIMVPYRVIFEALGAKVDWDNSNPVAFKVYGEKDGKKITLTIGSSKADVNGQEYTLDAVPFIIAGRTFVPIRFIAETLGCKVDWINEGAGRVEISTK